MGKHCAAGFEQQGGTLIGSGSSGDADLGQAVALSSDGNTMALGGPADNNYIGATWIFVRVPSGEWRQQGDKLIGTGGIGPQIQQGIDVALSADGGVLAVGGWWDNSDVGATWIFERTAGGEWRQVGGKLVGSGGVGKQWQGRAIALSRDGRALAVGGFRDDNYIGAAWIFTRAEGGEWVQQGAKLTGSGGVGDQYQGRGMSMSSDGGVLAVGGDGDASNTGAVWVFKRSSGGQWLQQGGKLVGTGATGMFQGRAVALSGDGFTLAIGAPGEGPTGATWVFTQSSGEWT